MKKTQLLFAQLAVAMALLIAPATAFAGGGPVYNALRGPVLDPYATTMLQVVPPKGGYVMVHRGGKLVTWFQQAGAMSVVPNQSYNLAAIVGSTMVFNGGIVARPGLTSVVWSGNSATPAISFVPTRRFRPGRVGVDRRRHHTQQRAVPRRISQRHLGTRQYQRLMRNMRATPSEHGRLAVLRRYATKYRFRAWQARQALRVFRSRRYKQLALQAIKGTSRANTKRAARRAVRRNTARKLSRKTTARKTSVRPKLALPQQSRHNTARARVARR